MQFNLTWNCQSSSSTSQMLGLQAFITCFLFLIPKVKVNIKCGAFWLRKYV